VLLLVERPVDILTEDTKLKDNKIGVHTVNNTEVAGTVVTLDGPSRRWKGMMIERCTWLFFLIYKRLNWIKEGELLYLELGEIE